MESGLSIVIPVFNEEKAIRPLYDILVVVFSKLKIPYRFIFINDGSRDKSLQVLNEISATDSNVSVFSQTNQGHGPAILKGYKAALTAEWVMQMDADNPYDTDAFEIMWEQKGQYDFLVGDRNQNGGSFSRKLISFISVWIVALLTGKVFNNINTPYRLIRANTLKDALELIPEDSFAPNIMLSIFCLRKKRILVTPLRYKSALGVKKSSMSGYIAGGALTSVFQLIQFRFRL